MVATVVTSCCGLRTLCVSLRVSLCDCEAGSPTPLLTQLTRQFVPVYLRHHGSRAWINPSLVFAPRPSTRLDERATRHVQHGDVIEGHAHAREGSAAKPAFGLALQF